jgi:hypothetical protein
MPASGGMTVFNPGTNLATSMVRTPCRLKTFPALRTHKSGSSDRRHSLASTLAPRRRPMGLNLDQNVWDASTFSQNRRRRFDRSSVLEQPAS